MKRSFDPIIILAGLLAVIVLGVPARADVLPEMTDRSGRIVRAAKPFTRIISLYGAHTENLFTLGAGDALIGVSRNDRFPPEVHAKSRFSYHDGLERFLAATPDLVLIRPMIDRGYAALVAGLERNGITVLSLQPGTVEEMYAYWRILGLVVGRKDRAEAMIGAFQQAVTEFKALSAAIRPRQRVYFEAIHRRMKTFAPGSMPIFALETAGGINVAADADRVRNTNIAFYGQERILSRAEDIDVYLAQRGAMNQATVEDILKAPGFSVIRAVRNKRICIVDEALVARPTLRLLMGVDQIGQCLYPELFKPQGRRILERAGLSTVKQES